MNKSKSVTIAGKVTSTSVNTLVIESEVDIPDGIGGGTAVYLTVPVERKKKLIRPEGAKWIIIARPASHNNSHSALSLNNGRGIACATSDGDFLIDEDQWRHGYGKLYLAQQAAEHYMANHELHGFKWETEEETEEDWAAC